MNINPYCYIQARMHKVNLTTRQLFGPDMRTVSYLAYLEVELLRDAGWDTFTLSFYDCTGMLMENKLR